MKIWISFCHPRLRFVKNDVRQSPETPTGPSADTTAACSSQNNRYPRPAMLACLDAAHCCLHLPTGLGCQLMRVSLLFHGQPPGGLLQHNTGYPPAVQKSSPQRSSPDALLHPVPPAPVRHRHAGRGGQLKTIPIFEVVVPAKACM